MHQIECSQPAAVRQKSHLKTSRQGCGMACVRSWQQGRGCGVSFAAACDAMRTEDPLRIVGRKAWVKDSVPYPLWVVGENAMFWSFFLSLSRACLGISSMLS
jgi:hypothetical protein